MVGWWLISIPFLEAFFTTGVIGEMETDTTTFRYLHIKFWKLNLLEGRKSHKI